MTAPLLRAATPRTVLYAQPMKLDRWTVGLLTIGPDGTREMHDAVLGLTTVETQRWLDAQRAARAAETEQTRG